MGKIPESRGSDKNLPAESERRVSRFRGFLPCEKTENGYIAAVLRHLITIRLGRFLRVGPARDPLFFIT
jgi:hypothetical protein